MKKQIITFVFPALIALAVAGFLYKRYKIPPSIDLPEIVLTDLSGHHVSLQSFAGHPLLVNFFATWCGPCIKELPELAELTSKLSDQKLQIICISDEPVAILQNLQVQMDDERLIILHSERSLHDLGIYTYPTNYIYNSQGRKVYEQVNAENWENPAVVSRVRKIIE